MGKSPQSSWFLHLPCQSVSPVFSRKCPLLGVLPEQPSLPLPSSSASCLQEAPLSHEVGFVRDPYQERAQLLSSHHSQGLRALVTHLAYLISEGMYNKQGHLSSPFVILPEQGITFIFVFQSCGLPHCTSVAPVRTSPM